MTVYDFISGKENSTGKLFEKWSLTQLGEYMNEYAKLASESNDIQNVSGIQLSFAQCRDIRKMCGDVRVNNHSVVLELVGKIDNMIREFDKSTLSHYR